MVSGSRRGAVLFAFAGVCLAALASGCGSSKPKQIAVVDVQSCMTSHGYTFKKWPEDTVLSLLSKLPTDGAYEANSADNSVSVEYAFGNDAKEAKNIAQKIYEIGAFVGPSKDDYKITSNVAYWWKTKTGGDNDTVQGCLSTATKGAATRSGQAPTRFGLCKKPGIRYVGRSAEGLKVCFTLNSEGTKLIESGWNFAGRSGSGCGGISKNAVPGSVSMGPDPEHAGTSGQRFEGHGLSGTIRDANGSLLSTASGVLSDALNCPGKTFKWTAYRTP